MLWQDNKPDLMQSMQSWQMKSRHHLLQASGSGGVIEAPGLVQRGGHKVVVRCVRGSSYDFGCVILQHGCGCVLAILQGFPNAGCFVCRSRHQQILLAEQLNVCNSQGSQALTGWQFE